MSEPERVLLTFQTSDDGTVEAVLSDSEDASPNPRQHGMDAFDALGEYDQRWREIHRRNPDMTFAQVRGFVLATWLDEVTPEEERDARD
jgi:hypothetical protein